MGVGPFGDHLEHRFEQTQYILVAVHATDVEQEIRVRWNRIANPCLSGDGGVINNTKNRICGFGYNIDTLLGNAQDVAEVVSGGL